MNTERHNRTVAARFSSAAHDYDTYAAIQQAAADRLMELVANQPAPPRLLEIGCGSGLLTQRLIEAFPSADIDSIDISPDMVEKTRTLLGNHKRLHLTVADAATYQSARPYPLIVSSSALHWIVPLSGATMNLYRLLTPGGRCAAAIMLKGTLGELHEGRLQVAPEKPPLAALPSEQQALDAFGDAGLDVSESVTQTEVVSYPSARDFLQSIHSQGLTGGSFSRAAKPLSKSELEQLVAVYDASYAHDQGGVRASFEILFLNAHKSEA